MRPTSIVRFEQVYLAEVLLGVINWLLLWDTLNAAYASDPNGAMLGPGFLIGSLVFSLTISLLLWFFTARQGSNIARWILVIFLIVGLMSTAYSFAVGAEAPGISGFLSVVATALQIAALYFLFRPDARAWFADGEEISADTFE
ncbi:hypothetical protein [Sphingomonas sp. 37zxx]|uniref:hypothetical protein n=1 Tax=Sphingomonas sp. 37zxx TaxID=1550073 RepID=UPI00053BDA2F|nr:hypothetical protein [Sphingomonas sp. 37zxx]